MEKAVRPDTLAPQKFFKWNYLGNVYIQGEYCFLRESRFIKVIDATDLSSFTVLDSFAVFGDDVLDIELVGIYDSLAFVQSQDGFTYLFDLADPFDWVQQGRLEDEGRALEPPCEYSDTLAFCINSARSQYYPDLYIFDISDPVNPELASTVAVNYYGRYFKLAKNIGYLFTDNNLSVLDFTNISEPSIITSTGGTAQNGMVVRDTLYISLSGYLNYIRMGDPENPYHYTFHHFPGGIMDMDYENGYIYVTTRYGLRVLSESSRDLIGFYNMPVVPRKLAVHNTNTIIITQRDAFILEFDDETISTENEQPELPDQFEIGCVYPNPFNSMIRITLSIPMLSAIDASLFNILGQKIAEINLGQVQAGEKTISWDLEELPAGVYFLHVETDRGEKAVKKLVLMR